MPSVSVIIPAYNSVRTIARTIDSVIAQSFHDFEIVVVDDGSNDGTPEAVARYGSRITLIRQNRGGPSAARNAGARVAKGKYFAFLDSDDCWMPSMLARCMGALAANPHCVLVYSDLLTVDSEGRAAGVELVNTPTAHAPSLDELLQRMWPIYPCATVMRSDAFHGAGGFCEALSGCEDIHFWVVMRKQGEFLYLSEKLARYTYDTYPAILKALRRDEAGGAAKFNAVMRSDFGDSAEGLIAYFAKHKVSLLSRIGLLAMRHGDRRAARRSFMRAIAWDPYRVKTYLRLMRTFLPTSVAARLSGHASHPT